jgi:hypothetical protein
MRKCKKGRSGCSIALVFFASLCMTCTMATLAAAQSQNTPGDAISSPNPSQMPLPAVPFPGETNAEPPVSVGGEERFVLMATPLEYGDPALENQLQLMQPSIEPLPPLPYEAPLDAAGTTSGAEGNRAKAGMGGGFGMGPGMGSGGGGPIRYKTSWFPTASLKNQTGNWGMVGQDFAFMAPIWMDSPNIVMLNGGVVNRLITTDAIMPDTGGKYPDNLWNATLGLMFVRKMEEGRMFTAGVNVGSASDRPFGSINEMNVSAMAMYRRPSGERNAWNFGVIYSPTGEIQFPIPMVSYFWNPSDHFQMNIGLPFSAVYRPDDRWTFEASFMPIHTISAKASYRLTEQLKIVGGYYCTNEAYSLYDRVDNHDRFFMYDQRVSLGLESPVCSWLTLELSGGYAFDRYSYCGQQWDSTQYNRVDIANGPFVILNASLRR